MNKVVLIIIAILFPPLAVFLNNGAGKQLVLNIILSIFLFIPGLLHAVWLVTRE